MVGDRLSTDIAMAATADMDSALVLTGETTPEMAAGCPHDGAPTWILDRIDHLLPATEGAGGRRRRRWLSAPKALEERPHPSRLGRSVDLPATSVTRSGREVVSRTPGAGWS